MYTVVSLTVDLAGEPDAIDFTLALFRSIFYCYGCFISWWLESLSVLTPNMRSRYALWPATVRNNVDEIKTSIVLFFFFFFFITRFLLSHRAPVRGTLPFTAPCLPRRISQTRMITALNLGRHHRHPETLYPGICPDMSDPRGKSKEDPCWIRLREPCLGSQVRGQSPCCPVRVVIHWNVNNNAIERAHSDLLRCMFSWCPQIWIKQGL